MKDMAMRVDGNAMAGTLGEVFIHDMTMARIACGGCGEAEPIGAEHVYMRAPGIVLRCRHCDDVLLVMTQPPGRTLLAFPRSRWIELAAEA